MTDQTIPAGLTREDEQAVREWAERILTMWDSDNPAAKAAHIVLAALPSPPRPTLADMTDEERADCKWMQCNAGPYGRRGLIVKVKDWSVHVADKETGVHSYYSPDLVTARPDLPRMKWDGTPTAPDHLAVGTVIESADDPRLAALPDGSILLDSNEEATTKRYWGWSGAGYAPEEDGGAEFGPWTVLHIPKEADQ